MQELDLLLLITGSNIDLGQKNTLPIASARREQSAGISDGLYDDQIRTRLARVAK